MFKRRESQHLRRPLLLSPPQLKGISSSILSGGGMIAASRFAAVVACSSVGSEIGLISTLSWGLPSNSTSPSNSSIV